MEPKIVSHDEWVAARGGKPVGGGMVPYVKPKVSSSNVTYQAGPGNDVELVYKVEAVMEMMGSVVACRVVP